MSKQSAKEKAVVLRKAGKTYSEILKEIPVAKSTLSLWLRDVGLAKAQKQNITQKRLDAALRGALKRKTDRIALTEKIKKEAAIEIGKLDKKVFWLVGAALYWAEGNKQKEHNIASGVKFCNSDPLMAKYYHNWLIEYCGVTKENIQFEVYIHEGCDIVGAVDYWRKIIPISLDVPIPVRIKKGNTASYRKNKGKDYYGVVRMTVRRSTNLNRKIMGWTEELCKQFMLYSGVV